MIGRRSLRFATDAVGVGPLGAASGCLYFGTQTVRDDLGGGGSALLSQHRPQASVNLSYIYGAGSGGRRCGCCGLDAEGITLYRPLSRSWKPPLRYFFKKRPKRSMPLGDVNVTTLLPQTRKGLPS